MTKLSEEAQAYEPQRTKNVAELSSVSVDLDVKEENDVEYPYKYIELDEQRYRVPKSVLGQLKALLEDNKDLKNVQVRAIGTGKDTQYAVIPLKE
jgi:hypothetical protein